MKSNTMHKHGEEREEQAGEEAKEEGETRTNNRRRHTTLLPLDTTQAPIKKIKPDTQQKLGYEYKI